MDFKICGFKIWIRLIIMWILSATLVRACYITMMEPSYLSWLGICATMHWFVAMLYFKFASSVKHFNIIVGLYVGKIFLWIISCVGENYNLSILSLLLFSHSCSLSNTYGFAHQVLTFFDCLWPLVQGMLSPAILPRCINNNSNYSHSNQSVALVSQGLSPEQIDRHLKSRIDCEM